MASSIVLRYGHGTSQPFTADIDPAVDPAIKTPSTGGHHPGFFAISPFRYRAMLRVKGMA